MINFPMLKKGPFGYEEMSSEEIDEVRWEEEVMNNPDKHPVNYALFQMELNNPSLSNISDIEYKIGIDFMTNQATYKRTSDKYNNL